MMPLSEMTAIKDDPCSTLAQKVWLLFNGGMPCSWIDDFLLVPPLTAKRIIMERWSFL